MASNMRKDTTISLALLYLKLVAVLSVVWLTGYFGFSVTWLMAGALIYVSTNYYRAKRERQSHLATELAMDEKKMIKSTVEDLPSWVFFPDVERAEWLNKVLSQIWPFVGDYVRDLLLNSVQDKVQKSLPASLGKFEFTRIDLGDVSPRIGGIKVYTDHVRRNEILIDMEIFYASDTEIKMKVKKLSAGIKDFQLKGTLRVEMKPLIKRMPLIGGISVFFLNKPSVDFNLTNLANALDIPGLSDMLHGIVEDQIANLMVLPNRIPVQLAKGVDIDKLRYPMPEGVLRIHVVGARDLRKADINLFGMGKSDGYCKLYIGAMDPFKTRIIKDDLNPVWNEIFETVINCRDGQELNVRVFDEDPGNKNDKLGNVSVDIGPVADSGHTDTWLPLEDVTTGSIHLKLTWLNLSDDQGDLKQVSTISQGDERLSTSLLTVSVDSASDLPMSIKKMSEPSPLVKMSLGHREQKTSFKKDTCQPIWEESFNFLVANPELQDLNLEVMDEKTDKCLGYLSVSLRTLLQEKSMTKDRRYALKNSGPDSSINMRLCLRVLKEGAAPETPKQRNFSETPENGTHITREADNSKPDADGGGDASLSETPNMDRDNPPKLSDSLDDTPTLRRRNSGASNISTRTNAPTSGADEGLGKIQVTLRYSSQRNRLVIVIHKCQNLTPCDDDQLADPYVRMYLLPDKSSLGKKKTQVIKNNLNPIYDETFEFSLSSSDASNRTLHLSVKNSVSIFSKNRTAMGSVQVPLADYRLHSAVTQWFYIQDSTAGSPIKSE